MSALPDVSIRRASANDLDAVAALFLACWRHSYRGVLPDRVVEKYDRASARELWRYSFAGATDGRELFVAEHPGHTVVGVVTMGEDPDRPGTGHIFSLYVHPEAHGQGIGGGLLAAAVERLASLGFSEASLWVFEANTRARSFYERLGWHPDGTRRVEPAYGEWESRLVRFLGDHDRPKTPGAAG